MLAVLMMLHRALRIVVVVAAGVIAPAGGG